jgi:hypothetical protein
MNDADWDKFESDIEAAFEQVAEKLPHFSAVQVPTAVIISVRDFTDWGNAS